MSYYIIPSHTSFLQFEVVATNTKPFPFVSKSLNNILTQLNTTCDISGILNTYSYLHQQVPGTDTSVSKHKKTLFYFEVLETFNTLHMHEWFTTLPANILSDELGMVECISSTYDSAKEANIIIHHAMTPLQMWEMLWLINTKQSKNGCCIFKVNDMSYKYSVDFTFILALLYEKVYVTKPSISNPASSERLLVCKNYNPTSLFQMYPPFDIASSKHIQSFIRTPIPCHFLFKIEELNVIYGQMQLDAFRTDQKKKKNSPDIANRLNIQKCIQWCEKHNVVHNKFVETVNIFLNAKIAPDK